MISSCTAVNLQIALTPSLTGYADTSIVAISATSFSKTLDDTFTVSTTGTVNTICRTIDGKIYIGGSFTTVDGYPYQRFARLNPDRTLDTSYSNLLFNGTVNKIIQVSSGKIYVVGSFATVFGLPFARLIRLNSDGSLDPTFIPLNINSIVFDIIELQSGKLLLVGYFTLVNGTTQYNRARLNTDGTLDTTFLANIAAVTGALRAIELTNGKILVTGTSSTKRLNSDGTVDSTFSITFFSGLSSTTVRFYKLHNGSILVTGNFSSVIYVGITYPYSGIARLTPEGDLDVNQTPCNIVFNDTVLVAIELYNKKLLIGGNFTSSAGPSIGQNRIARLNPDLTFDPTFTDTPNNTVFTFAKLSEKTVIIGGSFSAINNKAQSGLAVLELDQPVTYDLQIADSNYTTVSILTSFESANLLYNTEIYKNSIPFAGDFIIGSANFNTTTETCEVTAASSIKILPQIELASEISGNNLTPLLPETSGFVFVATPSSNISLQISSLNYPDLTGVSNLFIARVLVLNNNTQAQFVSSFYTSPTLSYNFPITSFGIHSISISGYPVTATNLSVSSEAGYINEFYNLGFNTPQTNLYQVYNNAYTLSAEISTYPKYAPSLSVLTGYYPLKSIYPNNTGTVFEFTPNATLVNNSSNTSPVLSFAWQEPFGLQYGVSANDTAIYRRIYQDTFFNLDPIPLQLSLVAEVTGDLYPNFIQINDSKTITFVAPPIVNFKIESEVTAQQDSDLIVLQNITFNLPITATLPFAYILDTGDGATFTGNNLVSSINYSITSAPGSLLTATLSVFPLLSASTNWNYITSFDRDIETGILPITTSIRYILNEFDTIIPLENLGIDYSTTKIAYNNREVPEQQITDARAISGIVLKNQFDQELTPFITVSGYLKDSSILTLQQLKTLLNKQDIYLTLEFSNYTKQSTFNLTTLLSGTQITLPTPLGFSEVKLSARSRNSVATSTKTISYTGRFSNFITPALYFSKFVPSWYASITNPYPFEVTVWCDSDNSIDTIQTYVQGSNSYPFDKQLTRYSRLLPQWKFKDVNNNPYEIFPINNVKLYNSLDTSYIGTSGIATFYFIDDSPTGPDGEMLVVSPIVSGLIALQDSQDNVTQQPGYANSLQRATLIYHVNHLHPTKLDITRDGIRQLKPYYWKTNSVPNTITISTKQALNEPLSIDFSYPYENGTTPIEVGIQYDNSMVFTKYPFENTDFFTVNFFNSSFDFTRDQGLPTTGFARTSITPTYEPGEYKLVAKATVQPVNQHFKNPFIWLCDNKNNLITKIYTQPYTLKAEYLECQKNNIQQSYTITAVSGTNNTTGQFGLTGTAGASNIAIDGYFNAWVTDANNDIIYKISPQNTILKTINLPTGSSPGSICTDSQQNVWVTLVDDVSALKFSNEGDLLLGISYNSTFEPYNEDNIYKPGSIETDINDNVWVTFYNSICSVVNHYTNTGELLNSVNMPLFYSPTEVIIDSRYPNTVYAVTEHYQDDNKYALGTLHRITNYTSEVLLSGFNTPTHFNIDNEYNYWAILGDTFVLHYNLQEQQWYKYDFTSFLQDANNRVVPLPAISEFPGNTWYPTIPGLQQKWASIAYGKQTYVALSEVNGASGIYSKDYGITWSPVIISNSNESWTSIAFGNDIFLSISKNIITTSPDGLQWTTQTYLNNWHTLEYLNNEFIALSNTNVSKSSNGVTWASYSLPSNVNWRDIAYGDNVYMCVGTALSSYTPEISGRTVIASSPDLSNWTTVFASSATPKNDGIHIAYGSNKFVILRFGSDLETVDSIGDMEIGTTFVIGGFTEAPSTFLYSTNQGNTWTSFDTQFKTNWSDLTYTDYGFVAVGNNSPDRIITSDDGLNWYTANYQDTTSFLHKIASSVESIVIVSSQGQQQIIRSNLQRETVFEPSVLPDKQYNKLTGIGADRDGTIWIVSSEQNKLYHFFIDSEEALSLINSFNIYPATPVKSMFYDILNKNSWNNTPYTVIHNNNAYDVINSDWEIGVQAYGDWTGLRRSLKLCPPFTTFAYSISGESASFELKTQPLEIRTLNDSYNLSETLSNIFPEALGPDNVPILHKQFLPGALGTNQAEYQTISRQFFEKIANFARNHNDPDFCNIPQLYNLAKTLDVTIDNYNLNYPADIQRLIDIFSIQFKRLYGDINKYNKNLKIKDIIQSQDDIISLAEKRNFNIKEPLDANYELQAGQGLIVSDNINESYDLIYINTNTKLKDLEGYGLRPVFNEDIEQLFDYYTFYNHIPNKIQPMVNSFIDWDNEYTTITPNNSSLQEWIGENGIVEQTFNYYLNKGLGFLK